MLTIPTTDARAVALMAAMHRGDVEALQQLLRDTPQLAAGRIVDHRGVSRSLLHVAADWPGHYPNGAQVIATLIAAGADVNAPVIHPDPNGPPETPLHWAASNDDVIVIDALLDGGADIEISGAIFTGGPPMSDAVIFAQWNAARRLVERGAATTLWQASALGLLDRVRDFCSTEPRPAPDEIANAFWNACRGGQRPTAEYLLGLGADLNRVGHDDMTPLDVALQSGDDEVVRWLRSLDARRATGGT